MAPRVVALAALSAIVAAMVACGKKGPPLPPLRPLPGAIDGFAVERIDGTVTLTLTVPAANLDGSRPPAIDRVEIYALTTAGDAPLPPVSAMVVPANRIVTLAVQRARAREPAQTTEPRPLAAGDLARATETVSPAGGDGRVRHYVAMGWAGRRPGPPSPLRSMPLDETPRPPAAVVAQYSERALEFSWARGPEGQRYVVEGARGDAPAGRLTPEPLADPVFTLPVEFGRERCMVVRAVAVSEGVRVVGAASEPACVTPVDRFAPPPPTGVLAVAGETGIELSWTASSAADVAGYFVLRGVGEGATLQRLTPAPIAAAPFVDTTVQAGVTYVYVVTAVDRAVPPNESAPSERVVVTARGRRGAKDR